ncbi:MAG: hypothetical protein ACREEQ_06980, partial [Caulobacteraceae bacterium]
MGLFATHPPVEKRIEALIRYGGGREAVEAAPPAVTEPEAPQPSPQGGPWGGRVGGPWGDTA